MKLDRRSLLIGGGTGIGLVLVFSLWPRRLASELPIGRGEQAFGSFIKVGRDGHVTVAVPQVETGQGIWTGLPQIVADEIGAAWDMVAVEPAPVGNNYANGLAPQSGWPSGTRVTAGSTSVRAFERPMREAAAIARAMLIGAAADRWNVDAAKCDTADGLVIYGVRTVPFAELAEEAAARTPPTSSPVRSSLKGRLVAQPLPRLDGPAKARGSWRFAGDVRLPGMLYAAVRLAPPGARLSSFSRDAIKGMPGLAHLFANERRIAIVAESWWQAERALKAANPVLTFSEGTVNPRRIYDDALASVALNEWFSRGNYDQAVQGSRPLAATYFAAPSQHLQLEPVSATARVVGGQVELWAGTQAPQFDAISATLYPMPVGGPAGRAIEADAAPIAVELAHALGRPVQVVLSQSVGQNHDRVAPGALARLTALPGAGGITAALAMRVATADGVSAALFRLSGKKEGRKFGGAAMDGTVPPYSIPHLRIDAVDVKVPFTAGYMRGSPQREFTFFIESFVDELAHAAGMEPLAFRMSMLGGNPRLARCLQAAAQVAGWDGGAAGSMMGLAGASSYGSHIGVVAVASIDGAGRIKAHRIVAAVDCGRIINNGLVEQQVQGGLVWALGQATVRSPEWIGGMPRARPIGGIDLPRLADTPEIMVQLLPSDNDPGGVSGLGTLALAPALANAIHAGSGLRMRSLPFSTAIS